MIIVYLVNVFNRGGCGMVGLFFVQNYIYYLCLIVYVDFGDGFVYQFDVFDIGDWDLFENVVNVFRFCILLFIVYQDVGKGVCKIVYVLVIIN